MNKHKVKQHRKSDTKTANRDHIRTKAETLKLVDILMQNTGASDTLESKLERGFEDLKEELANEIKEIKEQIGKSMRITGQQNSTSLNRDNIERNLPQNMQNAATSTAAANKEPNTKNVFIVGDDTTSVLSPRILSDTNIPVKVKKHRGGNILTLKNTLEKMASDSLHYLKKCKLCYFMLVQMISRMHSQQNQWQMNWKRQPVSSKKLIRMLKYSFYQLPQEEKTDWLILLSVRQTDLS